MSEPSKKSSKKKPKKRPEVNPDLPDDESIRKLFPKRIVDKLNKAIEHEPRKTKRKP